MTYSIRVPEIKHLINNHLHYLAKATILIFGKEGENWEADRFEEAIISL